MRGLFAQRFECGAEGCEGMKVGCVRGQITHACACGCDGRLHARHLVAGPVIRDDEGTRPPRRAEAFFPRREDGLAVPRAVPDQRRGERADTPACAAGGGVPGSGRHSSEAARPLWGTAARAGHRRAGACGLEADPRRPLERGLVCFPLGACRRHVVASWRAGVQRCCEASGATAPADAPPPSCG